MNDAIDAAHQSNGCDSSYDFSGAVLADETIGAAVTAVIAVAVVPVDFATLVTAVAVAAVVVAVVAVAVVIDASDAGDGADVTVAGETTFAPVATVYGAVYTLVLLGAGTGGLFIAPSNAISGFGLPALPALPGATDCSVASNDAS
jgi:hypothetical protein